MKTIKDNISNEIIIKNSKFITELIKVNNINEIDNLLLTIKNKYKDATHYCYGYIIDNIKRFSDDGEPSGTAGSPILNVLEKNNLKYILCVVIRYYGGIKLGAGGLVRAYSKSTSEAIKQADLTPLIKGYQVTIEFDYSDIKQIDFLSSKYIVIDKIFNEKIRYDLLVKESDWDVFKNLFNNYLIITVKDTFI